MHSQTAASLIALTRELTPKRIMFGGFSSLSFPDIADLRNVFLSVWFDGIKASHLLFVDADMQWEPELIFDMLVADKPLIGAIYPRKRNPISWVGLAPFTPPAASGGNLLELESLGCGVMLIRRNYDREHDRKRCLRSPDGPDTTRCEPYLSRMVLNA